MGYYDSVKNNVKDNKDTSKPNFSTLRQAAQESSESGEQHQGDNTQIEVLGEGLNPRGSQNNSTTSQSMNQSVNQSASSQNVSSQVNNQSQQSSSEPVQQDNSGLEEKLDRIIEQNDRMIEILESFGS